MYMENNFKIDINEVLRYLGYRGQKIDVELINQINEVISEAKILFKPRCIYEQYKIIKENNEIKLKGTLLSLKGNDIYQLLKDSDRCVLMAATIGIEIERKINLYSKVNLTRAVILDACATAVVEEVCDRAEDKIKNELLNFDEGLTYRYSPGYGDLGLDIQKDFIGTLGCDKKIGIKASSDMILFPRKSVTAIIGITKSKNDVKRSCKKCNNYDSCSFRREDDSFGCIKCN